MQWYESLGMGGAVLLVVYRLGTLLINRLGAGEAARTKVIADGFAAITEVLNGLVRSTARLEGKLTAVTDARARRSRRRAGAADPPIAGRRARKTQPPEHPA